MAEPELQQLMLVELKKHLSGPLCVAEETSAPQTLGEGTAASRSKIEESTDLAYGISHPSGAVDISIEAEPRLHAEGNFICGLCGKKLQQQHECNGYQERHEKGRSYWRIEHDCGKSFRTFDSVKRHAKSVRYTNSSLFCLLIYVFRFTRKKHFLVGAVRRYIANVIN